MTYRYTIVEIDEETERYVRSVNAYCRQKTAQQVAEQMNAEAWLFRSGRRYEVREA